MSDKQNINITNHVGPGFFSTLFLVFLTLKLLEIINWSWWWVTAPLWGPIALILSLVVIITTIGLIGLGCKRLFKK